MKIELTDYQDYLFPIKGQNASSVDRGLYVEARTDDGKLIWREFVSADTQWESETENQIGRLGAVRELYPNDAKIAVAEKRVTTKARHILRNAR